MKVDNEPRRGRRDGERGRGSRERGRGRGRGPELIQSHSIFEQGPAEMMMKKRSRVFLSSSSPVGVGLVSVRQL